MSDGAGGTAAASISCAAGGGAEAAFSAAAPPSRDCGMISGAAARSATMSRQGTPGLGSAKTAGPSASAPQYRPAVANDVSTSRFVVRGIDFPVSLRRATRGTYRDLESAHTADFGRHRSDMKRWPSCDCSGESCRATDEKRSAQAFSGAPVPEAAGQIPAACSSADSESSRWVSNLCRCGTLRRHPTSPKSRLSALLVRVMFSACPSRAMDSG